MFPKIRDAITNNDSYQSAEVLPSEAEKWFRYSKILAGQVRDCAVRSQSNIDLQSGIN
jgi:hypothetical protein